MKVEKFARTLEVKTACPLDIQLGRSALAFSLNKWFDW